MHKSSRILGALSAILGRPSFEALTKQIRIAIGSRPHAMDAASGRRLLSALFSGRRETELLMCRIGRPRR